MTMNVMAFLMTMMRTITGKEEQDYDDDNLAYDNDDADNDDDDNDDADNDDDDNDDDDNDDDDNDRQGGKTCGLELMSIAMVMSP